MERILKNQALQSYTEFADPDDFIDAVNQNKEFETYLCQLYIPEWQSALVPYTKTKAQYTC